MKCPVEDSCAQESRTLLHERLGIYLPGVHATDDSESIAMDYVRVVC